MSARRDQPGRVVSQEHGAGSDGAADTDSGDCARSAAVRVSAHPHRGAPRGGKVNRKRVHRLYRLEGLQVRMRVRRRKRLSLHRGPAPEPTALGERWSMDFVHDQLADGRAFRVLTVVDNWSRESVLLEAGLRLTGERVAAALSRVARHRLLPRSITFDHGTEFTSRALDQWAWENVIGHTARSGHLTPSEYARSGRRRDVEEAPL